MIYLLALLIGLIAGLRAMTAPAAISWAAHLGCMPTKTLIASAYAAHLARRGADYGVVIAAPIGIDMPRVKARADAVSTTSRTNIENCLRGMPGCTVGKGQARFQSSDTVRVGINC